MSNLVFATLAIEGTRPLLWNAFTLDAIPLTKREKTGVAGNDPEEWRRSVLAQPDGTLYLPPTYLFGCLRDAARYTRRGRGSLQAPLAATLQVLDDLLPLANRCLPAELPTDPTQPVYLDVRSVKNPNTRGRNIRYRVAAAPGWQVTARLCWDVSLISRAELAAVALDAGRLVGLGDGRGIGFGRFEVLALEVNDATQ